MSEQPKARGRDMKTKILSDSERREVLGEKGSMHRLPQRAILTACTFEVAHRGLTVYRLGTPYPPQRWMWNEYRGKRIGGGFRWGRWAWSFRWARP